MKEIQTKPGLLEPVQNSQRIFKAVLEALSKPGRIVEVFDLAPSPYAEEEPGRGFGCGFTALALALCDQDTPVWLDAACDGAETRHHLRFHCACPLAESPDGAAFAFIGDAAQMPQLRLFSQGTPEYPDRSASLIIRAGLGGCGGDNFQFSGPGVQGSNQGKSLACNIQGLPGWFRQSWQENQAAYPLGVDVLLVDESPLSDPLPHFQILGLPRSVSFEPLRLPRRLNKEGLQCMSQ